MEQKISKFQSPHIKYHEKRELCKQLKQEYFDLVNNSQINNWNIRTILKNKYHVPRSTLTGWIRKWETDPEWLPGNFSKYSLVKRIFDDNTEKAVSMFIEQNYITPGYYLPDSGFRDIIYHAYNENDEIRRDFHCSPGFIRDFKNRNGFSSRLAHIKKRPDIENGSEDEAFIQKVN